VCWCVFACVFFQHNISSLWQQAGQMCVCVCAFVCERDLLSECVCVYVCESVYVCFPRDISSLWQQAGRADMCMFVCVRDRVSE